MLNQRYRRGGEGKGNRCPLWGESGERERRIGHRVMSKWIPHIEAKVNCPAGASAQNGPKCAASRGLGRGRVGAATGLLGMAPPICRTFSLRVPRKVSRLHTKVQECVTNHYRVKGNRKALGAGEHGSGPTASDAWGCVLLESREAHTGAVVRLLDGGRRGGKGCVGTVERTYGHPDHLAMEVRFEDGSAELCWHHELAEVKGNAPRSPRSVSDGGG